MSRKDETDRISEYERAICYYTLPKVVSPVTFGLIIAYLVCLLEAIAALTYGLIAQDPLWTRIGVYALVGVILLGVIIFLVRAFINDLRQRRLISSARGVPDAPPIEALDIPDPFADHVLLRHPRTVRSGSFDCTDKEGNVVYHVEGDGARKWHVTDPEGSEVVTVRVIAGLRSFYFDTGMPGRVIVYQDGREIAHTHRRFSFTQPVVEVHCLEPERVTYTIKHRTIYRGDAMAGRIYYLRHYLYLDVEQDEYHPALLGLFVSMAAF